MKLIPLILLTSLSVGMRAQKFRQDQFPLPPQFQNSFPGFLSSDSSLYLPPESNTQLPYFPMNNMNIPYQYLPPTGTKAPSAFPTPYPFIISSSIVSNMDDDDDEEEGRIRMSSQHSPTQNQNHTERRYGPQQFNGANKENREMREMKAAPRMNYPNFPNPIDRIDVKLPMKFSYSTQQQQTTQAPVNQPQPLGPRINENKRMIIDNRNDLGLDQVKAASFQGPNFLHAGPGPIFVSSTTEPAIPILRLSNEMDLDGSFSYEALGADQTHYMQHSHMENMGTDKEEQVVEGSYSYVGDNGQTYTVHYIADSNGFRASGEHLPVAPPIPEIIQRAVQYNLAEEAKKPPHLRNNWQDDGRDNEIATNNERQPQFVSPPRNLFTGRTPEAFSYSYSQGTNTQNNLVAAGSSQVPVKAEYTTEQAKAKPNNGPISPQITFLASQGAHVPALNTPQNSISRMFTTEKSSMPQIVNYEAAVKDQDREESNKALWRWQYGINVNNNLGQNQNKDTISRSIGEPDEVMINFSDMSAEQYTHMMKSQLEPQPESMGFAQYKQNQQTNSLNQNSYPVNFQQTSQNMKMRSPNPGPNINYYQNLPNPAINLTANVKNYQNQLSSNIKSYQNSPNYNLNNYKNGNKDNVTPQKEAGAKVEHQQANPNDNNQQIKVRHDQQISNIKSYQESPNYNMNNYQTVDKEMMPQKGANLNAEQQQPYPVFNNQQTKVSSEAVPYFSSTQATSTYKLMENWPKQASEETNNQQAQPASKPAESREIYFNAKPKLVTHKDFVFPTQSHIVTQDYNFEDDFYEPRKIKSLNVDAANNYSPKSYNEFSDTAQKATSNNDANKFHLQNSEQSQHDDDDINNTPVYSKEKAVTPSVWFSTNVVEYETTVSSTAQPKLSTFGAMTGFKFTDFIVKDNDNKHEFANSDFKPIITELPRQVETTTATTTEANVEEIIQNNIFLKNLLNPQKTKEPEKKVDVKNKEEPKKVMPLSNKLYAEPKTEKPIIFIHSQSKPANELKSPKKKHVDISDIINYVSMKNHFELNKTKPKSKQTSSNMDQMSEIRFIPVQQEKPNGNFQENSNNFNQPNNYRTFNHEQQEELKGIIRNYKVLQRNKNVNNQDNSSLRTDLSPPPLKPLSLPPLGRAGPSMKSYLPPIYV